jgi:hypothetical protein
LLLVGCSTSGPSSGFRAGQSAKEPPSPAPTRCSAEDPDRGAWFCVIGQILYGIVGGRKPEVTLYSR